MELVALSSEQTQYMWVTLRKRPRPFLDAVTSTSSSSTSVPQRGPQAAVSLWIRNAPSGADLTTLRAQINGEPVRGAYLTPILADGRCQMNVTLPRNLPIGTVEVALVCNGEVMSPMRAISIEPVLLVPRVSAVYDARNMAMEKRSESGGLKILMEGIEEPGTIEFQLADKRIENIDVTVTNQVLYQCLFSLIPPGIYGPQTLATYSGGRRVYRDDVDIQIPVATLVAVTLISDGSTCVPRRGPNAAVSLWIRNAPADANLMILSAQINGKTVPGTYLSPVGAEGGCQMNVLLPGNVPLGDVDVALVQNGQVIGAARTITVRNER